MTRGGPRVTAARHSLAGLLRGALHVDRTQSDPVVAFRNAVGVAAPLAIGALAGSAAFGLTASIGAQQAAFADRPGPYRLRLVRMLGVAAAAAITSGLAMTAGGSTAGSVVLIFVLALVAGFLLAGGPSAAQAGTAGVVAALVLGHIPQPPSAALHVALLVFAGAAGQAVLATAAWPLGRHRPERFALAGVYGELAGIARAPRGTRTGPPGGESLLSARATLYGMGHDHGPSVEAYRALLDEAERLRREVVVVAASAERLSGDAPELAAAVRAALGAGAGVLQRIATALHGGTPLPPWTGELAGAAVRSAIAALEHGSAPGGPATRAAAAARLRAFAGELRAAAEAADVGASEGGREEGTPALARLRSAIRLPRLRDPIAILRANLTPDSAVVRHAIRLAVLVAASDLVVRLLGYQRGYWVPLTLLVILRPDFGATVQRGLLRMAGTVLGLLLATGLVHVMPGGDWWPVLLIFLFAFGMRLSGPNNVGLTALNLSGLVVVLLELSGVPAHTTLVSRTVATAAGGALAICAVLAFPTWERDLLPQRLAQLLRAYHAYLDAVGDPRAGRDRLHDARAACRVARTNAQASLDRVTAEPVPAPGSIDLGRAVLTHTHRFAHAALAVDAVRTAVRDAGGLDLLAPFLTEAGAVLDAALASAVDRTPPPQPGRLRAAQERLVEAITAAPESVGGGDTAAVLQDATDRITDSLDTLLAELRRQVAGSARQRAAVK